MVKAAATDNANIRLQKLDGDAVNAALEGFSDASWRQFPAYAAAAAREIGAADEYMSVFAGNEIIALANVRLRQMPVLPGGIALISHGPMSIKHGDEFNPSKFERAMAALAQHYAHDRGYCLRVDSPLNPEIAQQRMRAMEMAGFRPHQENRYQTFVIDLSPGIETLRKSLNGKWRTDLNRAERQNLTIEKSTAPKDFDRFAPLLENLSREKGFSPPQDTAFFRDVARTAERNENIVLHMAFADNELVAGHIGAFSGDMAVYLLGAANAKGRELRAAYLLQWAAINHAKSLHMRYYDLGGADQVENPSVFRFKKRMGGDLITNIPAHQIWPPQPRKTIIAGAEWAYGKLRGPR